MLPPASPSRWQWFSRTGQKAFGSDSATSGSVDHPPSGASVRVAALSPGVFAALQDVWQVAASPQRLVCLLARVPLIPAEVLAARLRGRTRDNHPAEHGQEERHVMPLGTAPSRDSGIPFPSTKRLRLVPFFPFVRRVRPDGLQGERLFDRGPINALPTPGDALQFVVLGETLAPEHHEDLLPLPLEEVLVDALALPNAALGRAFHWQPLRRTKMIASKNCRGSMGLRLPPGWRRYRRPYFIFRLGMAGLTLAHSCPETVQDLMALMAQVSSRWRWQELMTDDLYV